MYFLMENQNTNCPVTEAKDFNVTGPYKTLKEVNEFLISEGEEIYSPEGIVGVDENWSSRYMLVKPIKFLKIVPEVKIDFTVSELTQKERR